MSCVNPSYVEGVIDDYTGLIRYKFFGHGRYLKVSDFGSIDDLIDGKRVRIPVPCRTCLGCRIDYSREWANRMCLEMLCSGQACFITLTYNNSSLPLTKDLIPTLCKRDWQLFMKRLRKAFPDRKLRFYMCGEYGSHTLRPHYHAIIFGLDIFAFPDLKYLKKSPWNLSSKLGSKPMPGRRDERVNSGKAPRSSDLEEPKCFFKVYLET